MSSERVEAQFTVPASMSITAQAASMSSPVSVTATAGSTFLSSLLLDIQTQLNNNVQGYPQTAAAVAAAIGYGTWTAGYLCNETSGDLTAVFGSPTLAANGSPTYGTAGPCAGIDKAVGIDSATDAFIAPGNTDFDVGATDDLIVAWVGRWQSLPSYYGAMFSKATAAFANGWAITGTDGTGISFAAGASAAHFSTIGVNYMQGQWHVGIAAIDRTAGTIRIGVRSLSGTTVLGNSDTISGSCSTAIPFALGANGGWVPGNDGFQVAAFYVGKGVGCATGVNANLSDALANFEAAINARWAVSMSASSALVSIGWTGYATPTFSVTFTSTGLRDFIGFDADIAGATTTQSGTSAPHGVWFPSRPLVADSDPRQAPKGDNSASAIAPDGSVYSVAGTTYYRHRNVRFPKVSKTRVWSNDASPPGSDWETFYLETQLGQHAWFSSRSRVKVYWTNAGTLTELGSGAVSSWRMPSPVKLDELRLGPNGWTGVVDIVLGDLYASS